MKKYDNFCRALQNLSDVFLYEEPYDNVVLTGLVALYEICFEQAWKAMKEILERYGYEESATGSPRQILKTAFKAGLIKDEQLWLGALMSRNNVAHAYNKSVALDILKAVNADYFHMFENFREEVKKNWQEDFQNL